MNSSKQIFTSLVAYTGLFSQFALVIHSHCGNLVLCNISNCVPTQRPMMRKYNAHTDPLFKSLNFLKVEHILKLQELKLYHKFSNNKLPVYLQNLPLNQNNSVHNFNTRGQYNIHTIRVHHEFAKRSLRYSLPHTINNAPDLLKDKVTTHSLHGFSNYIKLYYLNTYIEQCAIQNCYICQHDWLCLRSYLVKITLCISDCTNIIGICNIQTYLY